MVLGLVSFSSPHPPTPARLTPAARATKPRRNRRLPIASGLVVVIIDHLPSVARGQLADQVAVDAVQDEVNAAVGEDEVRPAVVERPEVPGVGIAEVVGL